MHINLTLSNVRLIIITILFSSICLYTKSPSLTNVETLQILDECAKRNIHLKPSKISEKSITQFKEYCTETFKDFDAFPIVLFSFIQKNNPAESHWAITYLNKIKKSLNNIRINRIKSLLFWLQQNYLPKNLISFFYLAVEPYKVCWAMEKTILNRLDLLLDSSPLLISCNHPNLPWTKKAILIPDEYILQDSFHNQINSLLNTKINSSINYLSSDTSKQLQPFFKRKSKVFFSGALSGPQLPYTQENLTSNPRHQALMLLRKLPYLDIKITDFQKWAYPINDLYLNYLTQKFLHLESTPINYFEHAQNKYLLSFDGTGAAWSRPQLIMATGSVLFMNAECEQYFYQLMEPEKTHIVINKDFSNLDKEFQRLEASPELAEKIGAQGRAFTQQFFTKSAIDSYLWLILNKLEHLNNKDACHI